ncbi:MAG: hypothetical protein A3C93_05760 [Candidatus Lloydbacteria bacterium RIFCSPHIGHO2_02_FULL_54_17]|uniref:Uncharacterized protein n=1 Tax=Candidatus Lloydbacteria bacterium RIFCSPHIGHO2_02_FULL_54_17 TaxID=1798664 RepID=A0A1G2DD55_9BACT|nr:MAG: hypothetical protein A2762_03230 [Candidatus Lloydbacteria bacterium RIFCSPHIGHO2_01_FULL_54_11]OGZ10790.1 MAG: hypothetical protein A3C93_05760 [Candidatus Lloydbacteria bacterium RIFCSPHIGHO2_02_FULL_54_17]OGZ13091.1 MAG: hypothetical protein A2948_03740 [Candidatus Lloydbacteria bacterium RIFCSPLOWO2_01_FULL_54_18]OGZ16538.1 MAG: hypothetical protein A3H76_04600 [Candidatus Lloydbacteria bacterium RIFCSPLOWO2_02_FULL_54_12]
MNKEGLPEGISGNETAEALRREFALYTDERSRRFDRNIEDNMRSASPDSLDFLDAVKKNYSETHVSVLGTPVDIVGILHTPETYAFHRERIEERIRKSSAVFLECAPDAGGLFDEQTIAELREIIQKYVPGADMTGFQDAIVNDNPAVNFFRETESIAAKYDKPVVSSDPLAGGGHIVRFFKEVVGPGDSLRDFDIKVAELERIAATGALGVAGGVAFSLIYDQVRKGRGRREEGGANPRETLPEKKGGMSRRTFLKSALGLGAVGMVGALGVNLGARIDQELTSDPKLAAMLFELTDYRNTAIAKAMEMYAEEKHAELKTLCAVFGRYHEKPLAHYLAHPTLRETKYALYKPYRDLRAPELSEYRFRLSDHPDPTKGKFGRWEETLHRQLD